MLASDWRVADAAIRRQARTRAIVISLALTSPLFLVPYSHHSCTHIISESYRMHTVHYNVPLPVVQTLPIALLAHTWWILGTQKRLDLCQTNTRYLHRTWPRIEVSWTFENEIRHICALVQEKPQA